MTVFYEPVDDGYLGCMFRPLIHPVEHLILKLKSIKFTNNSNSINEPSPVGSDGSFVLTDFNSQGLTCLFD